MAFGFSTRPSDMGMSIPDHTRETLENYILRGWEPGGFVTAMLAMDMQRAIATADTANRQMMWTIGRWIMDNAPDGSWGSYPDVRAWTNDFQQCRSKWVAWHTLKSQEYA